MQQVWTLLTSEMNELLLQPYTVEEIKATFPNAPHKRPAGGWYACPFLSNSLAYFGPDVVSFVLFVLNGNGCPRRLNKTLVALIPKTKSPRKMTNFHPISLCNLLYKIISKILV